MVQWLGFYPSKVEVGVRFTVVARTSFLIFDFFFLFRLYTNSNTYVQILKLLIIGNRDFKAQLDPVCDNFPSGRQIFLLLSDLD